MFITIFGLTIYVKKNFFKNKNTDFTTITLPIFILSIILNVLSSGHASIQFNSIQFIDQLRALKGQQENCTQMNKQYAQ